MKNLEFERQESAITEASAQNALEIQGAEIQDRQKKQNPHLMEKLRKWAAPVVLMLGSSFVATGCSSEKPNFTPDAQKIENKTKDHSAHEFLQRIKKEHEEKIKHMKKTAAELKAGMHSSQSEEAKQVREEMGEMPDTLKKLEQDKKIIHSEKITSPEAEEFLK